jgi:PAS domain S-box-containing protein
MKINLPVTGREKTYPADYTLVSRTDTKGIITFANDKFVEVCGFTRKELVGTNHNIIRHPDVPPAIFAAMWNTIKQGFPWQGVVKNRCKDGDHYWVKARVVPVIKSGTIIGYMSVRTCPTREEIAAAEQAYREAADARATVRELTGAGWRRLFSIKNGVSLGIVFVTLLMIAGGFLGIAGLNRSNQALQSLYHEEMSPIRAIGRINFLMAENRAQVALASHHDPAAAGAADLDHGIGAHGEAIGRNKEEIDVLWQGYTRFIRDETERRLAETYWQARNRYVREGLMAARAAMERGDFAALDRLLLERVSPLYDEANAKVAVLLRHLSDRALANYTGVLERNRTIAAVAVAGIVFGALILAVAGLYFLRVTVLPLQSAVAALERITEGDLAETAETSAYGETARVTAAVTVMRSHLKVMMDEIRQSSGAIHEQCRHLNRTMMNLAEHSEEQHDRVYQTLDSLLESCAGLNALVANAEALREAITAGPAPAEGRDATVAGLSGEVGHPTTGAAPALDMRAEEVAGAVRLLSFTVEDVSAQLKQVAALIVENREEVQGAWAASQRLEEAARELDGLVQYFE